jgi:hypothetical protein
MKLTKKEKTASLLLDLFVDFNDKAEVIYYVDPVDELVMCSTGKETKLICPINEVESATSTEDDVLFIEADKTFKLTKSGPMEVQK